MTSKDRDVFEMGPATLRSRLDKNTLLVQVTTLRLTFVVASQDQQKAAAHWHKTKVAGRHAESFVKRTTGCGSSERWQTFSNLQHRHGGYIQVHSPTKEMLHHVLLYGANITFSAFKLGTTSYVTSLSFLRP